METTEDSAEVIKLARKMREDIEIMCSYISSNRIKEVEEALCHITDINLTIAWEGTSETTALCVACRLGHSDIVNMLLKSGADPNISTVSPALLLAASHEADNADMVRKLILTHDAHVNAKNSLGRTALHMACEANNFKVVKCLVMFGADVNDTGSFTGDTFMPLTLAAPTENMEMVRYLVEHGADTEASYGDILDWTMSANSVPMLKYLIEIQMGVSFNLPDLIFFVYQNLYKPMIKVLLDLGIDINEADIDDETPLHCACSSACHWDMIEFLMNCGGDIHARSPNLENTLLHSVVEGIYVNSEKIKFLLDHKIEIDARNARNKTALELVLSAMGKDGYDITIELGMKASQLLSNAGARVHPTVCPRVKQSVQASEILSSEQQQRICKFLENLQQPKRLIDHCCIKIRSLLPVPINKSASQLPEILPSHVLKGFIDYDL